MAAVFKTRSIIFRVASGSSTSTIKHDGLLRVVNVVKDNPTILVKRARCQDAGNIGSHDPQPVPPSAGGLGVDLNRADVREWNVESAPERPKLVEAFDVEMNAITFD